MGWPTPFNHTLCRRWPPETINALGGQPHDAERSRRHLPEVVAAVLLKSPLQGSMLRLPRPLYAALFQQRPGWGLTLPRRPLYSCRRRVGSQTSPDSGWLLCPPRPPPARRHPLIVVAPSMATGGAVAGAAAIPLSPAAPIADTPVAIVSGANSGIGLAVCVALTRSGHTVYGGMRPTASADALLAASAAAAAAAAPGDRPGTIHVLRMDVGDDDSVASAIAAVLVVTGDRVDVAVANAGFTERLTVEDAPVRDYASMMNVNFLGAVRLVKACVPSMRRRRAGRILGVSSVAGLVGIPFFSAYCASKFAMEGFWECCHAEYKALGVHFVLVRYGGW